MWAARLVASVAASLTRTTSVLARNQILHSTIQVTTQRLADTIDGAEAQATKTLCRICRSICGVATKCQCVADRTVKTGENTTTRA